MPWLLPSFSKRVKVKKENKVVVDIASFDANLHQPSLVNPPINPTNYTFRKITKGGFRKSTKSLKTPGEFHCCNISLYRFFHFEYAY